MPLMLEVKWAQQSDHADFHRRVEAIGGASAALEWRHTQEQAIEAIQRGLFHYYFKHEGNHHRLEVGMTAEGGKYLKTKGDVEPSLLLLRLPAFPTATA